MDRVKFQFILSHFNFSMRFQIGTPWGKFYPQVVQFEFNWNFDAFYDEISNFSQSGINSFSLHLYLILSPQV